MSKNTRNRILLTALAALLLVAISVGGTVAYLKATTSSITNTFTAAGITVTLAETMDNDGNWTMKMIPGTSKTKDPVVSVKNDVDMWLFVKFEGSHPADLTFTNNLTDANGWKKLTEVDGVSNVWYREVKADEKNGTGVCDDSDCTKGADESNEHWHLILNDIVSVEKTKEGTNGTVAGGTMTYTAYAIQKTMGDDRAFTVAEAWQQLNPSTGN